MEKIGIVKEHDKDNGSMVDPPSLPPTGDHPLPAPLPPPDKNKEFANQKASEPETVMTFLGLNWNKEDTALLWKSILQNLNTAIEHQKKRALKSLRKWREENQ